MAPMIGTASVEPSAVPALKMPTARARSRIGNHSAAAFTPPGITAASAAPSAKRATWNPKTDRASACDIAAADHALTKYR